MSSGSNTSSSNSGAGYTNAGFRSRRSIQSRASTGYFYAHTRGVGVERCQSRMSLKSWNAFYLQLLQTPIRQIRLQTSHLVSRKTREDSLRDVLPEKISWFRKVNVSSFSIWLSDPYTTNRLVSRKTRRFETNFTDWSQIRIFFSFTGRESKF